MILLLLKITVLGFLTIVSAEILALIVALGVDIIYKIVRRMDK